MTDLRACAPSPKQVSGRLDWLIPCVGGQGSQVHRDRKERLDYQGRGRGGRGAVLRGQPGLARPEALEMTVVRAAAENKG